MLLRALSATLLPCDSRGRLLYSGGVKERGTIYIAGHQAILHRTFLFNGHHGAAGQRGTIAGRGLHDPFERAPADVRRRQRQRLFATTSTRTTRISVAYTSTTQTD